MISASDKNSDASLAFFAACKACSLRLAADPPPLSASFSAAASRSSLSLAKSAGVRI